MDFVAVCCEFLGHVATGKTGNAGDQRFHLLPYMKLKGAAFRTVAWQDLPCVGSSFHANTPARYTARPESSAWPSAVAPDTCDAATRACIRASTTVLACWCRWQRQSRRQC